MPQCRLLAPLVVVLLLLAAGPATAEDGLPRHGLSAFGALKYPPDFRHFTYADPAAPKGGELRLWALDSFDTLNPFLLKGVAPEGLAYNGIAPDGAGFVFEPLMEAALDEPDAVYGLVAESAELRPDLSEVAFTLRPEARFHDGTPITAADVAFTFRSLVGKGHPRYALLYRDVAAVEVAGPRRIAFKLAPDAPRDLPLLLARMPVLSAADFQGRDFAEGGMRPLLGSGPYRIEKADPGRSVTYRRVADHWASALPVNRGRHNFDVIRYDYFRDRDIALEAFFAGAYDFRDEPTSRHWATAYDRPAVQKGLIVREVLPDRTSSGVQGFFLNTRREKLKDPRVRKALAYAFDFEWMNRNLFYGLYKRSRSMFENTELAAHGLPAAAELALLAPFRDRLPAEVFEQAYDPPKSDGSGTLRENLRIARDLLAQAGWRLKDGVLRHEATGEPLALEFLLFEGVFQRVATPYIANLERLGVQASIRLVDVAAFQNRMETFDYDIIVRRFSQPLTPGVEQRNYWGSAGADTRGSLNFSGIKDPVVDALIEHIVQAPDRPSLVAACHALDRVLTWGWYMIPHFYSGTFKVAYRNRFGRPALQPRFGLGHLDTWWVDPERERLLTAGIAPPPPAPFSN